MHIPVGFGTVSYIWIKDGDSEEMVTSFGFHTLGDPPTVSDANLMFEAWSTSSMQTTTTDSLTLLRVEYGVAVTTDDELIVATSDEAIVNGAGTSDPAPINCALLVKKVTGLSGRKNRGRFYYPDVFADVVSPAGVLSPAAVIDYQAAVLDWFGTLAAVGVLDGAVLLHTDPLDTPTPVLQVIVQNKIATQRRRLRP
jgi:hypothetical protein